jgi:hypothetical protein
MVPVALRSVIRELPRVGEAESLAAPRLRNKAIPVERVVPKTSQATSKGPK